MSKPTPKRMTAELEGDFVVFLIGIRINKPWKIHKWVPVAYAMYRMLKELDANPEAGLLGYIVGFRVITQYWRSFDHLESYARASDMEHWPAWVDFNKKLGNTRGDVGIWHETYLVRAGEYENVYSGMPPFGMSQFAKMVPATGSRDEARGRLRGGSEDAPEDSPALSQHDS